MSTTSILDFIVVIPFPAGLDSEQFSDWCEHTGVCISWFETPLGLVCNKDDAVSVAGFLDSAVRFFAE